MSDFERFKVGDLVIIDYDGQPHPVEYGIITKIDCSVVDGMKIYRVLHPDYDWQVPYSEYELKEIKNEYKPDELVSIQNSLRDNKEEDREERSKTHKEGRQ